MTQGYVVNIKKAAKDNDFFRKVLFTGTQSQLVLMSLRPREEIGTEVHKVDQILYVVDGEGKVVLDGVDKELDKGEIVFVPAGVQHNVINTDDEPMKLFTIYAPPQHAAGTMHRTKAVADEAEREALASAKA
ncbi:MAG TPA: cupin domain-containing protein [Candidatus Dormibacteraeota bacterium]|nr:cupin domain-containing protein [Candidatus Dormibacteraeota bacterium]